ncbi:lipid A biosynthesis acyltransferase [Sulfurimonas aquatica]|uniref:Lipid A biosynthesis acyltransferase n=1 Tax=Sulfurimonas aquatica TaxID=2672570 RepID=A0A975B1M5_9BACT|nr:lipid A biosynthesis lauroyl acyltransferase [Sulfurimonas aquatica]QSZ42587.1 lipid A biosynthesis acyltransferase [Sulfurimonas aquatica]
MGFKLLLVLEIILMALPKKIRKSFFLLLAYLGYKFSKRYRDVARANLNFVFDGSMSEEEIESIVKYSFKNLLLNFLHVMELRHMSLKELEATVSVENIEAVNKVHAENRAVIYVTSHYSSWELGGASLGAFVEPLAAVYKRMKNSIYEEWLLEARAHFGNTNLEKTGVVKPLVKLIKEKKASGILIDTNISPKEGVIVEFMGKNIRQTYSPAYLARKFNAAIIPVTIRTDDEEHYTLKLYDEIPVENTDDEKADILKATQLQADWLSKLITEEPKFWFWLHRRFKNDYPEIYN